MKLCFLLFTTYLCYEFSRNFDYHNDPYLYINGRPIVVRRFHPRVVITRDTPSDDSLTPITQPYSSTEHTMPPRSDNRKPKAQGFKQKVKHVFANILKDLTILKVFSFALFSIIFIFLGYQIRKHEEHGNYVRMPPS